MALEFIDNEKIKEMVDRFLQWKLPDNFAPDGGIIIDKTSDHQRVGTNLFDAAQAENMVRHMLNH